MPEIQPGLKGVYLATTESSFIDGEVGKLLYRGYNIHDLAERSTFEETAYLLLYGKLPTARELASFTAELTAHRTLPSALFEVIRAVAQAHPMDALRTALSALAAFDPEAKDTSPEAALRKGVRLTAQAPTIIAAHHRIREEREPIAPRSDLGHAANFLYMLFGEEHSPEDARTLDVDLILHAEHGANASAFTARVIASTQADLHAAITGAIGALKGPAHGGAAEAVMQMVEEIGSPERATDYIRERLARHEKIMGFGHRVYRAEDPRARHLRDRSRRMAQERGQPHWFQMLQIIEDQMKPYQERGIYVNVDFYAGSIYYLLGIPEDLFISVFAMGRVPGWVLQCIEQYRENVLIRPLLEYTGPLDLPYLPIEQRQ
ncbi:MAG: citrate (Si)-synthase [Chloroflexi bacterium]|nr:citrate (Si)-synthase [Chloroflexota bacterium]